MRHGLWLAGITLLWSADLNIGWDSLLPHCIMSSCDQWEFTPFFRPQWQSLCTKMSAVRAVQGDCERVYLLHSCVGSVCMFNSLIPGRCGCNLNFHFISSIYIVSISCEIALGWMSVMSQDLTDDEPTLVQVMTWCPSGNKPFPESMLTKFYDAMWCH